MVPLDSNLPRQQVKYNGNGFKSVCKTLNRIGDRLKIHRRQCCLKYTTIEGNEQDKSNPMYTTAPGFDSYRHPPYPGNTEPHT